MWFLVGILDLALSVMISSPRKVKRDLIQFHQRIHYVFPAWGGGGGGGGVGLVVNTSDSGSRGRGFEPHSGCRVVSLSKTYLPPPPKKKNKKKQQKSTDNTQEALAPSHHDLKIVYRDDKHQNKPKEPILCISILS